MSKADEPAGSPSIKVTDRRAFSSDGTRREADAAPESRSPDAQTASPPSLGAQLPGVDMATLVISFRGSALLDLGLLKDPSMPDRPPNLDGARQMIDILSLLRDKTRGNLTRDESELLDQVIEELQLHWVRARQAPPANP